MKKSIVGKTVFCKSLGFGTVAFHNLENDKILVEWNTERYNHLANKITFVEFVEIVEKPTKTIVQRVVEFSKGATQSDVNDLMWRLIWNFSGRNEYKLKSLLNHCKKQLKQLDLI